MSDDTEMTENDLSRMRSAAGIPRSMHDVKLEAFGNYGTMIKQWAMSDGLPLEMDKGRGWCFFGPGRNNQRLAYSTARILLMAKMSVQVRPLSWFVEHLEAGEVDNITDVDALILLDGYLLNAGEAFPFGTAMQLRLEGLLRYMMMDGASVSIQGEARATTWHAALGEWTWWSDTFRSYLLEQTSPVRCIL